MVDSRPISGSMTLSRITPAKALVITTMAGSMAPTVRSIRRRLSSS